MIFYYVFHYQIQKLINAPSKWFDRNGINRNANYNRLKGYLRKSLPKSFSHIWTLNFKVLFGNHLKKQF